MPTIHRQLYPLSAPINNSLTHWRWVTDICVSKLSIIGSDNGLSPDRRQAITWTNAGILLIGTLGTNFNEILIEIHTFLFKNIHLKTSGKWRPFCLGLNVLIGHVTVAIAGATILIVPISFRITSLALGQSYDCPSASEATLKYMGKQITWFHYTLLISSKHNKPLDIFYEPCCTPYQAERPPGLGS